MKQEISSSEAENCKALEIKPDDYMRLGLTEVMLYLNLGRKEEAIASYDKALEIKPDDHEAWHNRGNALDDLEDMKKRSPPTTKHWNLNPIIMRLGITEGLL
jgi:tetratricopeptide (TPR) repeat protein